MDTWLCFNHLIIFIKKVDDFKEIGRLVVYLADNAIYLEVEDHFQVHLKINFSF